MIKESIRVFQELLLFVCSVIKYSTRASCACAIPNIADDVGTITSSPQYLEEQVHLVQSFVHQNGLSLYIQKREIMIAAPVCNVAKPLISIDSKSIVTQKSVECLGFWFSWDLSATVAIKEAIKKARKTAYLASVSGLYQSSFSKSSI